MDKIQSLTGMLDQYDDGDMANGSSKLFEVEKIIKNDQGRIVQHTNKFPISGKTDDRWYAWRLQNWGTKWDLSCGHSEVTDNGRTIIVSGMTAWSPPHALLAYLCEDLGFDVMTASESFMEEVISEEDKARLKHNKKIEKERKKMAKKVVEEAKVEDNKIEFDMELDWDDI